MKRGDLRGHELWSGVQHDYLAPDQRDIAVPSVVAGVAVFKTIGASEDEPTLGVTGEADGVDCDRVVEQLQAFGGAGGACFRDTDFAGLEAIHPEPEERSDDQKARDFEHEEVIG